MSTGFPKVHLTTFIVAMFIMVLSMNSRQTLAQVSGWQYKIPVYIHENSGAPLTDYQVLLKVNTQVLISANKMNADGSDIRFSKTCDTANQVNYWIEGGLNTDSTWIWLKIPQLTASSIDTMYMYYGNALAKAVSSIPKTFKNEISSVSFAATMDEGSASKITDYSGNGNTGTINGAVKAPGKFGKALQFNGASDHVVTTFDPKENKEFSINVWCNPFSSSGEKMICGTCDVAWDGFWFEIISTSLRSYHQNSGCQIQGNENMTLNKWHLASLVYDGANLTHYLDGLQTQTQPCTMNNDYTNFFYVGSIGAYSLTSYIFDGMIDEVRFYNKALNPAEIKDVFDNYGYVTLNHPGFELIRKRTNIEPNAVAGAELPAAQNPSITLQNDTLFSTLASTYQWSLNDTDILGAAGKFHVPIVNGEYRVFVTFADGCAGHSDSIIINKQSAINEHSLDEKFRLYPNPNTGIFTLSTSGLYGEPVFGSVTNIMGQKIMEFSYKSTGTQHNAQINIEDQPAGLYIVQIRTNDESAVKKVYKE